MRRSLDRGTPNDLRHLGRERRCERRDRPDRTVLAALVDQRLGAHEDVEAREQVARERVPRRVRDLQPGEVRSALAKALEYFRRDGVAARGGELVDVERQRRARTCRGEEGRVLRTLVQLEGRRAPEEKSSLP